MRFAFLLAQRADPKRVRPNPLVGAVLVAQNGEIVGEGFHQQAGEGHAEVLAISDALQKNTDLSDCVLYVTMEPCSHHGKTPPCTDLILQHKIRKVVIGTMDPNPMVSGAKVLSAASVDVEFLILPELLELNSVFNINQVYKRPKYLLKSAITLNGKIADQFGNSKWISNVKSRQYVHSILRAHADAILTTAKTVIQDNASMNIRIDGMNPEELNLIVIDRKLDLLQSNNARLAVFYPRKNSTIYLVSDQQFSGPIKANVQVLQVPFVNGKCDLNILSERLLEKNICEVLIEAGGVLNAHMMDAGIVDELYIFITPTIFGDPHAINLFNSQGMQDLVHKSTVELIATEHFENDILAKYKVI